MSPCEDVRCLAVTEEKDMKRCTIAWKMAAGLFALALAGMLPSFASGRQLWAGGRNVDPATPACAVEKAAAKQALFQWDICMGGQTKPPVMGGNATVYYLERRRRCAPKYRIFTRAENRLNACQERRKGHPR